MTIRSLGVLVSLIVCTTARAQAPCDACDLAYHPPAAEPRGEHMDLSTARAVRNAGIGITVVGVAASIAGFAAASQFFSGSNSLSYDTMLDLSIGGTVGGASAIGIGAGMWGLGDLEVRRAEGRAPMLTPALRARRGRPMRVAGTVLTVLGSALALSSFIPLATPEHCDSGDDLCGLGTLLESGTLGALSSVMLGAGIPLLAIGSNEEKAGSEGFRIDSVSPRAMNGGGGIGISGRF